MISKQKINAEIHSLSVPDIVESGFILGISTLFLIIGVFHHFFIR